MHERFQIHLSVDVSILYEDLDKVIDDIKEHNQSLNISESSTEPIVQMECFLADKKDDDEWHWDTYCNLNPNAIIRE
tara:strand:- start:233 stop:463 length:231 start_codon:yes stop_codon:yes gene_type:complete